MTDKARLLSQSYHVSLGGGDDPVVIAAGLSLFVDNPHDRVTVLHDIADQLIARQQNDNASLVLNDAMNELARTGTLAVDYYPVSRYITAHDATSGSLRRAHLYLDLIQRYQRIGERVQIGLLTHPALNEILRSPQGGGHQQALMRYLAITSSLFVTDDVLITSPVDAILVYDHPALYSDLLRFLISFYDNEEGGDIVASRAFPQYVQLLIREYQGRYDWVSLAMHTAFRQHGWISAEQLAVVRNEVIDTPPVLDESTVMIVARGMARGNKNDLLLLYQRLANADREVRCAVAFSAPSILAMLLAGDDTLVDTLDCIATAESREVRIARAYDAVTTAIRVDSFNQDAVINGVLEGGSEWNVGTYLRVAQSYLESNQPERARFYINEFDSLYDVNVTQYEDAALFASLYASVNPSEQVVEQVRGKRNLHMKIAFLLEIDRRYGRINTPLYRQIALETTNAYLLSP